MEDDGRPVDLPRGRPCLLIAYLALHAGLHPRRRIAEHLWPDCGPEPARQRLRTALWEVHRALSDVDEPLVEASREHLGLHGAVAVDLVEARGLLDAGATEAALGLLAPGLAQQLDLDWAEQARREVDAWRLRALEAAVYEAPDAGAALPHARRRVALDPLSEGAHCDLIRLLANSGDRGAAMAAYERMRLVLESELGIGPSAASRRLLARLGSEDPPFADATAPPRVRRRIPVATTPLLGRDADLADLDAAVQAYRLVTVVGPAGVGKSRIAFAAAQQEADRGNGVAVAELATTRRADACDYVVAAALGVHAGPGRAIRDAMVDHLDLEPTLLVLDNCEHLLAPVRELVTHLMRWSAGTKVLATSRQSLALPGEHVVRLLPLSVPAEGDGEQAILASPAVQLLSSAARRRNAQTTSQTHRTGELARLARRLDGLPLALELAAARIPSLGVPVLEERLAAGMDVLSAGGAASGGRHDSLLGTLEWSMTMLSPHERTLLALLSLLPGQFPLTAVEAVVRAAGVSTDPVVGLARLVEASLIQVHEGEIWCYSELETIRMFGRRLLDDESAASARRGLVQWAVRFADDVRQREFTAEEERVHAEMVRFLPLMRAALQEARDRGDVEAQRRVITGIEGWSIWREQPEVWAWVSGLAAQEPEEHADADVLRMGAVAAWRLGQMHLMKTLTERCVAADPGGATGVTGAAALMLLAFAERRWADVAELARPICGAGWPDRTVAMTVVATALVRAGRPEAALDAVHTARRDAERCGTPSLRALALLAEARVCSETEPTSPDGRTDAMLAEARLLADSVGSAELVASIDKERGLQALRRGFPQRAVEPLRGACLYWLGTGQQGPLVRTIKGLAESLTGTGRQEAARHLLETVRNGELNGPLLAALIPLEDSPSHAVRGG